MTKKGGTDYEFARFHGRSNPVRSQGGLHAGLVFGSSLGQSLSYPAVVCLHTVFSDPDPAAYLHSCANSGQTMLPHSKARPMEGMRMYDVAGAKA